MSHSPGTVKKQAQKRSAYIRERLLTLADPAVVGYEEALSWSHDESLRVKLESHIVIDKVVEAGGHAGIGLSGLEGLAAGAVVMCSMHDPRFYDGYCPPPPVIDCRQGDEFEDRLRALLRTPVEDLVASGMDGHAWALEHATVDAFMKRIEAMS